MARKGSRFSRSDDESDINLTPMLDVVFIMLIFFIVTATFIKQAGIAVRSHIERLHAENPKGGLVIQADKGARYELLKAVLTAARGAGLSQVAISTEA